ncbi:Aromatic amino acid aminotransferase [Aspergillus sclerotialis]|uniref:Aromatic amino acid aminotransferase n=1 Tax=Aspergillus sclerotialis TaxID=2070753 RepID=A0A3A2ZJR3_9EURO|nr:Aromatic amino acid aminotransferase [Aspergillus sclerotialis]
MVLSERHIPAPPLDLSHHLSYTTRHRQASSVKEFYKYFQIPGIGNLAGGLPNPSYFPYDTLEAEVALPERFNPTTIQENAPANADPLSGRLKVPKESQTTNLQKRIDLMTALQYGTADGYPPLVSFLRKFTRDHLHPNVPYAGGPDIVLDCGSTDGFSKAIEAFTNVWNPERNWIRQREGVLCEEFAYMNAIQTAKPRGLNIVGIAMDAQGMRVSGKGGLADVLDNWDFRLGRRPHVLYTVTTGQNPTGSTLSVERKKEIYTLCQKYDVIIVEDEPYWNLQYPSVMKSTPSSPNYNINKKSSGYNFLDSLVPSYLSMDVDGRVVRLDTFSKTIAPGCRLGWITAQPAIVERLTRITETSTQQPSGFVQSMVAELLLGQSSDSSTSQSMSHERNWRMDGWIRWLEGLRGGYERRMTTMCRVLDEGKHTILDSDSNSQPDELDTWEIITKTQMYSFVWPAGGMFVWVKACLETHPLRSKYQLEKLSKALWVHLTRKPYLCLVSPGSMFAATEKAMEESVLYMRLCFAPMPEEDVESVSRRLADGFRAFWARKDLDGLDGDDDDAVERMEALSLEGAANLTGLGC